jgi:hypothetical protein
VGPGEKPVKRLTVAEAVELGDRRALLVALQLRLALALSDSSVHARDLAALSKRIEDAATEVAAIDAAAAGDDEDAVKVPDEPWDGSI